MKSFFNRWNEVFISPLALIAFALGYYFVSVKFGAEAGLIPLGYYTNIFAGLAIMYIAGVMASLAFKLNFGHFYFLVFKKEIQTTNSKFILGVCIYFGFYVLSIWALTSIL
jgi:hypothetical protein